MYEKLERYCQNKDIRVTVYVDDITFSGKAVNRLVGKHAANIIGEAGYKVNEKKTKFFNASTPKLISGVIIKGEEVKVRNKHQKRIHELLEELPEARDDEHLETMQKELLGRLDAAGQLEQRFSSVARVIRDKINNPISTNRFYNLSNQVQTSKKSLLGSMAKYWYPYSRIGHRFKSREGM